MTKSSVIFCWSGSTMHLSDDTHVLSCSGYRANSDCEYINVSTKKQLKQYVISCKTITDALKNVLNTKTSSASPLTPTGDSLPWTPAGAPPPGPNPDPHYKLALPRSPWVCVLLTRKPCCRCRKENARCCSCSCRFRVRRRHSLQV